MTRRRVALAVSLLALLTLAGCATSAASPAPRRTSEATATPPPEPTTMPSEFVPAMSPVLTAPQPAATAAQEPSAETVRMRLVDSVRNAPLPDVEVHVTGATFKAASDGTLTLPSTTVGATMTTDGYDPVTLTDRELRSGRVDIQPDARSTAGRYGAAIATGGLESAWSMLTPEAQAAWGQQESFAQFYAEKFRGAPITSVTTGAPAPAPPWTDPATGVSVDDGEAVPVGLVATVNGVATAIDGPAMLLVQRTGGWRVARLGAAGPEGTIIVPPARPARSARVPILMYHHVASRPARSRYRTELDFRLAYDLTVTPDAFAQQLDLLAARGYHPVAARAVLNFLFYGVPLPPKPVALTFDDGYLDNRTYALPALARAHMTATFSVVTGFVGQRGSDLQYMGWDDLQALVDSGMDVEPHTVDHKDLGTLSSGTALGELAQSRAALREHLHVPGDLLTYPSGEPFRSGSRARQQALLPLLPRAGYAGGLLDQRANDTLQSSQTPYQLPRVRVSGGESIQAFAASIGAASR